MQRSLIDTDTLSEVIKARDPSVQRHAANYLAAFGRFTFSIMTRYEILRGLKAKGADRQIMAFNERCRRSSILHLTDEIVVEAADIFGQLQRSGQLISDADILIAATARIHGLLLVTENVSHFQRIIGLQIESWRGH